MTRIRTIMLGATALLCLASGAQAYTRHPSTAAERAETKALNQEQLNQAQQQNTNLAMNIDASARDASAGMADNTPPAAAPTTPVQQADADGVRPPGSGPTSGR
jgi:type II secretory pathway component PulM